MMGSQNEKKTNKVASKVEQQEIVYEDYFFEQGHWLLKIRTIVLTILGWCAVFIPIYWTLTSTLLRRFKKITPIWTYQEGKESFYFLLQIFGIFFLGAIIFSVFMTLRSNYRIKHDYRKNITYDFDKMLKKRYALTQFFNKQFGPEEFRTTVKNYVVPEEKNLSANQIEKIYDEGGRK
ncbi:hypothetical protein [Enterococcus saigonensis]|nr:hypothetical protein [Enterococcus saigonensis]